MGLAITRRILEVMGSHLHIESHLGKGSTFSFSLKAPIVREASDASFSCRERNEDQTKMTSLAWQQNDFAILIAEDNPINMRMLTLFLEKNLPNSTIMSAHTGGEAINQWKTFQPDLILMDLLMPQMSGIEATKAIRLQETHGHTPIIAITAAVEKEKRDECFAAGMDDHLIKPIIFPELITALERWLTRKPR